jgi:hypothetical protein
VQQLLESWSLNEIAFAAKAIVQAVGERSASDIKKELSAASPRNLKRCTIWRTLKLHRCSL